VTARPPVVLVGLCVGEVAGIAVGDQVKLAEHDPLAEIARERDVVVGKSLHGTVKHSALRRVPHYLPGQNPFVDEMQKVYGIPVEAAMGGAETMYPEYRDKIKDKFKLPAKCTQNCGG